MEVPLLDLRGLKCPLPILRTKKALAQMQSGVLRVWATDPGVPEDFAAFCRHTGHLLLESTTENGVFSLLLQHKDGV